MIFFPTTLVIIDDNYPFIEVLGKLLENEIFIPQGFTRPLIAKAHVIDQEKKAFQAGLYPPENQNLYQEWVEILIHSKEKNQVVSCIISDQLMHAVLGLDVLQSMNVRASKIVISGALDDKEALTAMNKRIIQKFISKTDLDSFEKIRGYIEDEVGHFFDRIYNQSTDAQYCKTLRSLCLAKGFQELYPLDFAGTYLLRSSRGVEKRLYCPLPQHIKTQIEYAKNRSVSGDVISQLESGRYFMCATTEDLVENKISPDNWPKYMQELKTITGTEFAYCVA